MRNLLSTSGMGAIAVALASPATAAETVISTATTTPVVTSTTGDLRITSAGSIKRTTAGAAVTINSHAKVKNEGTIAITGANGSTGILANPGLAGDITNTGTITLDENYTPTDGDNDGDLDGPFAQGNNRFGIRVLGGGTYTGNVVNSGTILVEGNQSAGIAIDSALTGSLTNTGKITVTGKDGVAIRTSAVSGNVTVGNGANVSVQGQNSVGLLVGGNVGGSVVVQGGVSATGYRNTSVPADPSKLDSDDLLQGGSAVLVSGNVAGGILLDARPADNSTTDTDEDDDGIPDAQESTASVTSFGAAPALKIGSASQDVSVGAGSSGFGLVIKGAVGGHGVYSGVAGTGVSIGGAGHSVNIAGGMNLSGTVQASATKANATAIHIGDGATVPTINVLGTVTAQGGGTQTTAAQAIRIDSGATVNTIRNSGTIAAGLTGTDGSAAAIVDRSGTVSLIENSGNLGVANASELGSRGTAIDVSANTSGVVVQQIAAAAGKPAPLITGNILFGSGNDSLLVSAGTVSGNVDFGGGSDSFGLGGVFRGQLINSSGVTVNVGSGGFLDVRNLGAVSLASLTTGTNAQLGVTIGESGHTLYTVAGEANFGTGTNVVVTLQKVATAPGTYTIVDAGTLTGAGNLTSSVVTLPYLFTSSLASSPADGQVSLQVAFKSASELGLNTSETAVLDAALAAVDSDQSVAAVFLSLEDSATLKGTLQQLMPEHAGGAFETVSKSTRLAAEQLGDPRPLGTESGLWMQQFGWSSKKSIGSTADFDVGGWGVSGGYDRQLGPIGRVGVTAAYVAGRNSVAANDLVSDHYEGGIYWRGGTGPLRAFARAAAGTVSFDSTRNFAGEVDGTTVTRSTEGKWNGRVYSGAAGLSYTLRAGRLTFRPSASIDYIKLTEKGYTESGGGGAMDLTVRERSSNETGANALLAVGYELLGTDESATWLRLELQGGRREILSSSLGRTTASFGDGETFTLTPEERTSGWRGALRILGGGSSVSLVGEVGAEQLQGRTAVNGRLGLSFTM